MPHKMIKSRLMEEVKYTAKELGILGVNALANVVIIIWQFPEDAKADVDQELTISVVKIHLPRMLSSATSGGSCFRKISKNLRVEKNVRDNNQNRKS
ncbi:hypothetical protein GBV73_01605 [Thermococcus sp. 101 C5]|uniref:hypothetical protein n=2 Tax=Thermococcus TaxID=2263 RepID=UPI00128E2300|nr:hypothetical protein [Thermococcus sp. 101 C5]MPW38397.1 hypothetical protein [Thermococcus sp. 101 C5]